MLQVASKRSRVAASLVSLSDGTHPPPKAPMAASKLSWMSMKTGVFSTHIARSICSRKCCCGPMTLPGRISRRYPMASAAVKPLCLIMWHAISVPVLPSPARQCTATTPSPAASQMSRNLLTCSGVGLVQSSNQSAWCLNPFFSKASSSYRPPSLRRTTSVTPMLRKGATWSSGRRAPVYSSATDLGVANATNLGVILTMSYLSLSYVAR
mmetsp:Transcript_15915/g.31431  ORF Transcript_15915/g.31431 Transcript_15915/m.31431 type:complete len:210 (+) Transcript_15915:152-781(+)